MHSSILGCDYVQGFLVAPAFQLNRYANFLLEWVATKEGLPDSATDLRRLTKPAA